MSKSKLANILNSQLILILMCGINGLKDQGCGCRFRLCHTFLNMGVLLHKQATVPFHLIRAVHSHIPHHEGPLFLQELLSLFLH